MKILVMSDSHGNTNNMLSAVDLETPEVILHLGDHISDCGDITLLHPDILLRSVRGNCDRGFPGLDIDEFVMEEKRFLMTHGHLFSVKFGKSSIKKEAADRGADILLFGHTHIQHHTVADKLIVLNPGSIGVGTKEYAVIEINNGIIDCELKRL